MPTPLSWTSFRDAFISPAVPGAHGVPPRAGGQLFVDAGGGRIGLLVPLSSPPQALPRSGRSLSIRELNRNGQSFAELSTSAELLFESFFALASQIVHAIETGDSPGIAIEREIQAWRDLLKEAGRLSSQQEIGLWGELRVLEQLLERYGADALAAWGGPFGDVHDFRMAGFELEVKSTVGSLRRHIISSLEQLVASPNHRLLVVSNVLVEEAPPTGRTLPMLARSIAARLEPEQRIDFAERLASAGFAEDDAALFSKGYVARSGPRVVDVETELPTITRALLDASLGAPGSRRVIGVTYQLDMEGLGTSFDGHLPS